MKYSPVTALLFLLVISCQSTPQLEEGYWTGTLTPMNHPEISNPIGYQISYSGKDLAIQILAPDSSLIPSRNVRLENDTLYFQFNEPEERVTLDCALARHETAEEGFAGRCTDESGQWARFTMIPPK